MKVMSASPSKPSIASKVSNSTALVSPPRSSATRSQSSSTMIAGWATRASLAASLSNPSDFPDSSTAVVSGVAVSR